MSFIDCYEKELLGIVNCPADHEIVSYNDNQRDILIYRILQDIDEPGELFANKGDILLGGGSGESALFRLSMPLAIEWFSAENPSSKWSEIFAAYWTFNQAYVFGTGYIKIGWTLNIDLRMWLAEHLVAFLVKEYSEYRAYMGPEKFDEDGSICRLPTPGDIEGWMGTMIK